MSTLQQLRRLILAKKTLLLLILLLALGTFVRVYHIDSFPLGFDQIILLDNGQQILDGHPLLIGPKTGYANVFIGPFTYYLTALALFVIHSPYALVLYQLGIVACTIGLLIFLSYRYLPEKLRWIALVLWLFSPFILTFDRHPWNPSPLNLAAIAALFPLFAKKRFGWLEWGLVALGSFLGFQSHFSGVFVPLLVLCLTLKSKLPGVWMLRLSALIGFAISWFPLLVFDFRHNFINLGGLRDLLTKGNSSGSAQILLASIYRSGQTTIENLGKILFSRTNAPLFLSAGILFALLALYLLKKYRQQTLILPVLWVSLIALFFGFYQGPRPEYYYMLQFPALVLIVAHLLNQISSKALLYFLAFFFVCYSLMVTGKELLEDGLAMRDVVATSRHLQVMNRQTPISQISYDMPRTDAEGFRYLLKDLSFQPDGRRVHVAYPDNVTYTGSIRIGDATVWVDPRASNQHFSEPDYLILYPKPLEIFKGSTNPEHFGKPFRYVVFYNHQFLGDIYVLDEKTSNEHWSELQAVCLQALTCYADWPGVTLFGEQGNIHIFHETAFFFVPESQSDEVSQAINAITFY